MDAKKFFKGNAFKSIVALLCVLLVSGIILCIAYGFLEVKAGERLQRAIQGIYGTSVTVYGKDDIEITAEDTDPKGLVEKDQTVGRAVISQMYKIKLDNEETDYLVLSKGKGGYGGGSVTCWVALTYEQTEIVGIRKVQISENNGQSFIGKITDSFLNGFSKRYKEGTEEFVVTDKFVSSGASMSSAAICNSVNGALTFAKAYAAGEEIKGPYDGLEKIDISGVEFTSATAEIVKLYKNPENGNYTVLSKGKNGYENGTVTCAVTFEISGTTVTGLKKVVIDNADDNQSLIFKFNDEYLDRFVTGYTDGVEFPSGKDEGYVITGASLTSTAICNSVNGAVAFMKTYLSQGGVN